MIDPLAAYNIAEMLRQCAFNKVAATAAGPPARSCVITGGIAWDDCECGQLTVAITRTFSSQNFPTPALNTAQQFGVGRCGHPIIVFDYTVTMLRCVASSSDGIGSPSCADLAASAQVTVIDAAAVRDGVICCLQTMLRARDSNGSQLITGFTAGDQQFVGPEGACGGSAMDVQVGVLYQCPC